MIEQEEELVLNSVMYFMLPMLQLNKSSFGVGNFIDSYIDKNGYIVVDLNRITVDGVIANATFNNPHYVTDFDINGIIRVVYAIPDEFISDVRLFEKGRYSELSAGLKVLISKYANLVKDDIIIKCLNPQIKDRQKIADDLGVRIDLVRELKSAPDKSNFIKIK